MWCLIEFGGDKYSNIDTTTMSDSNHCYCPAGQADPSIEKMTIYTDNDGFGMDTICTNCNRPTDAYVYLEKFKGNLLDQRFLNSIWMFADFVDSRPVNLHCPSPDDCEIDTHHPIEFSNYNNETFRFIGKCKNGCKMEAFVRDWFNEGYESEPLDGRVYGSVGETFFKRFLASLATNDFHQRII